MRSERVCSDQDELSREELPVLIDFDTIYYYKMSGKNDKSPYQGCFSAV